VLLAEAGLLDLPARRRRRQLAADHSRRLNAGNPEWSPDGKRIVFNSGFDGQGPANIYTFRPNGSGLRLVLRARRNRADFEPVWQAHRLRPLHRRSHDADLDDEAQRNQAAQAHPRAGFALQPDRDVGSG
jgi:WD40-like Beta Propeller Repeat